MMYAARGRLRLQLGLSTSSSPSYSESVASWRSRDQKLQLSYTSFDGDREPGMLALLLYFFMGLVFIFLTV